MQEEIEKGLRKPADPLAKVFSDSKVSTIDFINKPSFRGGSGKRQGYKLVLFSWLATVVDILISFALSAFFILLFTFLVRATVGQVIHFFGGSQLKTILVFMLGVTIVYQITFHSFLGFTIGEWTCGLRLGGRKEQNSEYYPLRVLLRAVIVIMTGFVLLPILSLLAGRDLVGEISGLYLISAE